uniref:Uncharacterized protein n=2 Tax=Meloidogyne TaxID=189290 RepID=A0A6V7V1I0_MELEN|nr:unnamed protein product [Meloidogyne enterolobii]CAD2171557.1 unnamed protein product [Meloidogyne enterolobii]
MFKVLIIFCLIIKAHSVWYWTKDPIYPSPRGADYWICKVTKPTWVCDPDGMLTDLQREEIVDLVEDFKEKTKNPNSMFPCAREGLRLIVALANTAIALGDLPSTNLCNNGGWTSSNTTKCESDVVGIELNKYRFHYCHQIRWLEGINREDYEKLNRAEVAKLNNKNYFDVLKNYIINLQELYVQRFSIFDNLDVYNKNDLKLTEIQQSLNQQNKTLVETKKTLEEVKQLLVSQG